ncbi:MAG TPA: S-methyl-5-thioribose-1-phosphate isomerase [Burkholderiales bacterium]|nr:S-methyl-5-thioribose-1-phosphate isomerase [Burkholderiales bacterium]
MKVAGVPYRSVWRESERVAIIDQTRLPFEFHTLRLSGCDEIAHAIRSMQVRGAPLIGATAGFGIALAMSADPSDANLQLSAGSLGSTRPTAVNLRWAIERMTRRMHTIAPPARAAAAWMEAEKIADEDIAFNLAIGRHGLAVLRSIADKKGSVNVLTHCNAGWLATVDVGTALAPVYLAHDAGIPVHVWVDETRPRNQGLLTAWELSQHGVPNTLIADNAGGHLMQHGQVDLVIVGADRVTAAGDVCNKIGTYLKALAANDCGIPFYAAVPSPTIDWNIHDGLREIPIEERSAAEMLTMRVMDTENLVAHARIAPDGTHTANPAFDVTPARLVTAIISDRGIAPASREGLQDLYHRKVARP